MDIIAKFLPEKIKKALADKETANDLAIILGEVAPVMDAAAKNPATEPSLKAAFNEVAGVLPTFSTYLKEGRLPMMTMVKLGTSLPSLAKNGDVVGEAFNTGNPAALGIVRTLLGNKKAQDALKRIVVKPTGSDLFRLEQAKDGQCYGVELVSGSFMKIPLAKTDYDEIKAILDSAAKKKPTPPKALTLSYQLA